MRHKIALAALLIATPLEAEEALPVSRGAPVYTLQTPVETMAADLAAVAILNKDLPGLLTDPSYPSFKAMNLKQLQKASGGDLSIVDINKAVSDLQTLPH